MRRSLEISGWLCLLTTFALASAGVKAVRAEESAVAPKAPVCNAATQVPGKDVNALLESWRAAALAREAEAGTADPDRPIALNNRGYNYGPANTVDVGHILQQLQQAR